MRSACFWASVLIFFFLVPPVFSADAENQCPNIVGRFTSIDGEVVVRSEAGGGWHEATTKSVLCEADTIRVSERSRAAIQLINNAVLRLDQNTTLQLVNITENSEEWAWLDLGKGAIHAFSRAPWRVKVNTRHFKGLIGGTEFYVRAEPDRSRLTVLEGHVLVENKQGRITVNPSEEAVAQTGSAPYLQTVVQPRDAVQWGLYYPPVLAILDGRSEIIPTALPAAVQKALVLAGRGQSTAALNALEQAPEAERMAPFYLYRAAVLLSVGSVVEARNNIGAALKQAPNSELAHALLTIIEVVQNHREQALAEAERAVALKPSAAARIALSYAQQASSQLDAARDTLLAAAAESPDDPLVWARLGELRLMLGDRRLALTAVNHAISLSPNSARAQLILGFCTLAEFRTDEAKSAFTRALGLASADPLAHLGLGLAKISSGELEQGRREIEVAVALDSNSALLRAYLGKAYFTEKRAPLDATQYSLAKALDPLDPTAYLYDGIRKQTQNRPIEALRDLQTSKELNDNRAVYRGRLLLDQDRAARGISLARVYKDLNFTQLGLREASVSLDADPSNASAHRFLSDTYQGFRRREISRVSELLQAQLFQDVNVNPIQPSLAETNLNIVTLGGPASPGFNEFTPLFERNTTRFNTSGFGGSNNTFGGEGTVTAVYNRFSFGAGGLHYQSDGWRGNNGLNQHIYDFFAQAAITPELNVQAEYRHRESKEGDLAFNFDPAAFLREKSVVREQDTTRIGLRFSPGVGSHFLFSFIHSERTQQDQVDSLPLDPITTVTSNLRAHNNGNQFEGQYIVHRENISVVTGFAHSQVDKRIDGTVIFSDITLPEPIIAIDASRGVISNNRGYLYSHIKFPAPVTWTLGFSYDDYNETPLSASGFNPKIGMQWQMTTDLRLRAAWLRSAKPALVNNRTIEPTQVAGFNQLFDDINGTRSTRYGGGFDWQPTRDLFFGGEISWRQLDEPVFPEQETVVFEQRKEELHSLYLYWTPTNRLSAKAEFSYDHYRSQLGVPTENGAVPQAIETFSMPLSIAYFDPNGWFARLGGTFVHQRVRLADTSIQSQGNDSFFLMDADVGYRFPKRWGFASVGIKNLLDSKFQYQDDSFREFRDEPATGPYFPDRIIIGRIVFNF